MPKKTTVAKIEMLVAENPGITSTEISRQLKKPAGSVNTLLWYLFEKKRLKRKMKGGFFHYYKPATKAKIDGPIRNLLNEAKRNERQACVNDPRLAQEPTPAVSVTGQLAEICVLELKAEVDRVQRQRDEALARVRVLEAQVAGLQALEHGVAENVTRAVTDRVLERLVPEVDSAFSLLVDRLTETLAKAEVQSTLTAPVAPAVEKLTSELPSIEPQKIALTVEATFLPQRKRTRVAILGLLNEQEREMERRFGSMLELRFIPSCRRSKLRRRVEGCDFVLVMIKFLSHCSTEVIKDHPGYTIIPGGMSELSDRLTAISNRN